jgi:ParB/RepB/Spo0J family partition protein
MVYKEIPVDLVDPNPWQTRRKYDEDALVSLMASSSDKLGIRQVPLVRPHGKRYQIAYGHGRFQAWKALGKKTIMCRVEDLTDSAMKKELLVENVNRSNLKEKERFKAIEQYRLDPDVTDEAIKKKLKNKEWGWISELSRETGVPDPTLTNIYDVRSIRGMLVKVLDANNLKDLKKPTSSLILKTLGLPDEERVKLVVKAQSMGWSPDTTFKVKTALKEMKPEIRTLVLDKETELPQKVILSIGEIKDAETQKKVIDYIQTHQLNEDLSLKFIERTLSGEPPVAEVKEVDEVQIALSPFRQAYDYLSGCGINQYMVLSKANRWNDALELLDRIDEKVRELRKAKYAESR